MTLRSTSYGEIPQLNVPQSTFILEPEDAAKFWGDHIKGVQRITHQALGSVRNASQIALVGAGRCYDIDLKSYVEKPQLTDVRIIDLNEDEVRKAVERVRLRVRSGIEKLEFIKMDVTLVMAEFIEKLETLPLIEFEHELIEPFIELFKEIIQRRSIPPQLRQQHDVVLSDAILSQLVMAFCEYVFRYLKQNGLLDKKSLTSEEQLDSLRRELMYATYEIFLPDHLKVLQSMTKPGGKIVLIAENLGFESAMIPKYSRVAGGEKWLLERKFQGMNIMRNKKTKPVLSGGEKIDAAVRRLCPDLKVESAQQWRWNRVPPELHQGMLANTHEVIGVTLSVP